MKEAAAGAIDWPSVGQSALERFPAGWLLAAFAIFVLGWVLRGTAEPIMKYWKEDREAKRKYQLEMAKLNESKEKRLSQAKNTDRKGGR